MDDLNSLATDTCDTCGRRGTAVLFHHYGAPVLAQCSSCAPAEFERVSRRDIESWLRGDDRGDRR